VAKIEFQETSINGAYIVKGSFFEDVRGKVLKVFEKTTYSFYGIHFNCSEDMYICSKKNVIRGMHFQLYHPQTKLISPVVGNVYAVILDLRKDSKTYGKWYGYYLNQDEGNALLAPRGCAIGTLTISSKSVISCKCDGLYNMETSMGILYNDSKVDIRWPVDEKEQIIISDKDKALITFKEFDEKYQFEY